MNLMLMKAAGFTVLKLDVLCLSTHYFQRVQLQYVLLLSVWTKCLDSSLKGPPSEGGSIVQSLCLYLPWLLRVAVRNIEECSAFHV